MKLQTFGRTSGVAAAALALSVSLAACSSEDDGATDNGGSDNSSESDSGSGDSSESADAGAADGTFGDGCSEIPADGAGSFDGMVQDPVATAASNNPLLSTLVAAVTAAQLGDTLNDAPALTVFAPANPAFEAIPENMLNDLLAGAEQDGATSDLGVVLQHHVLGEKIDADAIEGEQPTLIGDNLTIEGNPEDGMTVSDGEVEANVLCGNIQTANATVYVIDAVLTNAQPAR